MGGMHDGGVSALPPHRRRALSDPQREWLSLRPRSSARARAGARAIFCWEDIFLWVLSAPDCLQRQLGGLNPACLSSLHHEPCIGVGSPPRDLGRRWKCAFRPPSFRPPARASSPRGATTRSLCTLPLLQETDGGSVVLRAVLHAGAGAGAGAGADAGAGGKVRFPPLFFRCAHPAAPWGAR